MSPSTMLEQYRTTLASPADHELVVWWYFGTTFLRLPGRAEIPVLHAETIMVYRPETLGPDSFRINWREVGCFRDPVTGAAATAWLNPLTGRLMPAPSRFMEGPSHHTISQDGERLVLELEQAHAVVESVEARVEQAGPALIITQTERKRRGFPLPDGSMPGPDSGNVTGTETVLTFFAAAEDAAAGVAETCSGAYSFVLDRIPGWMGMDGEAGDVIVRGVMRKATPSERVNPAAWSQLQTFFPEFFDGDAIAPSWA